MDEGELNREFGSRLRELRVRTHLSQSDLAKAASLSRTSVVNIEQGRQGVSLSTLFRLASALGCDAADLLPKVPDAVPALAIIGGDDPRSQQAVSRILRQAEFGA